MLVSLFVPKQAAGASLVYFDVWNPGGGQQVEVLSVVPVVSSEVAVVGTVGLDLFLTRTSAIGTGGTAAVVDGAGLTALSFTALDAIQAVSLSTISARLTPAGGATASAVISWISLFTEETTATTYNMNQSLTGRNAIIVPSSTGIRVVQGSVASVGNIGFNVLLRMTQK
jgi:siroheme synthase